MTKLVQESRSEPRFSSPSGFSAEGRVEGDLFAASWAFCGKGHESGVEGKEAINVKNFDVSTDDRLI